MKSGKPEPSCELDLLIKKKENQPSLTVEVVSEASRWIKSELAGAGIAYHYAACDNFDHYGFSVFTIIREHRTANLSLEIKVAEIGGVPYFFTNVRELGHGHSSLFPFSGEMGSEAGRQSLLEYLSDFILSCRKPVSFS